MDGNYTRDPMRGWLAKALAALAGLAASLISQAQSLDTSGAHATIGLPLQLLLRVRDPDAAVGLPLRDCLRAEFRQGDDQASAQPLTLAQTTRDSDGALRVTLTDNAPVREPLLFVRATWLCGPAFVREFTLLAEPPGGGTATRAPAPSSPLLAPIGMPSAEPPAPAIPAAGREVARARPAPHPASAVNRSAPRHATPATAPVTAPGTAPGMKAAATRSAAARHVPPPSPPVVPAPAPTAESPDVPPLAAEALRQIWQQDLAALREEQRQSRAQLARLGERLETAERENARGGWVGAAFGLVLGLVGAALAPRLAALRRQAPPARSTRTASVGAGRLSAWRRRWSAWRARRAERVGSAETDVERPARTEPAVTWPPADARPPEAPLGPGQALTSVEPPDEPPHEGFQGAGTRVAPSAFDSTGFGADPGQAVLDERPHLDLLHKIDRLASSGYVGASVTVLENARQGRVGQSPGILLRLLDRYGQLGQEWNRERVAGELAAIYNVRVPVPLGSDEGPALDAGGSLWLALVDAWPTGHAQAVLAAAVLRPASHAPLSLAAFRDAVWLHGVLAIRDTLEPGALPPIGVGGIDVAGAAATPNAATSWALEPLSG